MKDTEYKVVFLNGDEDIFYASSVLACFCAATCYMNNKCRDSRIKYISDKHGNNYKAFDFTYRTN